MPEDRYQELFKVSGALHFSPGGLNADLTVARPFTQKATVWLCETIAPPLLGVKVQFCIEKLMQAVDQKL